MKQSKGKSVLLGVIALLFIAQGALLRGAIWKDWKRDYAPKNDTFADAPGLDPGQFLIAVAGFREMLAGILWVRADSFFDSGNYDAILPLIRLVTLLDPQQIDVYATGMWHIGYNFTDEEQRSDRRYIPSALALGAEGAARNPKTYELYFETGWIWYHKVEDNYGTAVDWFKKAAAQDDLPPARHNLLIHAMEKNGQIEDALELYYQLYKEAEDRYQVDHQYANMQNRDTLENNLDNMLVRMVERGYQAKKMGIYDKGAYDTKPPFNVGFTCKVTVPAANVIKFEGTYNVLPLGTRIRVIVRDINYDHTIPGGVQWDEFKGVKLDPDKDVTYMQDQLYVRNQKFSKKCDMSKDPTMYPFRNKEGKYLIEFFYSPRNAPEHIQDKFGWNGEGMTDTNFISNKLRGREGINCLYTTLEIDRDMIKRRGKWADTMPVLMTKGYKEQGVTSTSDSDIIQIPSLRGK